MIRFDPTKIKFEIVRLKSVTTALGGSIGVLDETLTEGKKEVIKRLEMPLAVARSFIMSHKKMTKFLKPMYTCITYYDNLPIAMESHPLGALGELETEGFDGKPRRWEPASQLNFEKLHKALDLTTSTKWYFDGRYMYTFLHEDIDQVISEGTLLTADGHFRSVVSQTFDLQELGNPTKLNLDERSCLVFVSASGDKVVSPPIWKKLEEVGSTQLGKAGVVSEDGIAFTSFDAINEHLAVNLSFALKAGQEIGSTFGYEYIEPLQLPQLMVELCTVNLPNVPSEIKASYAIGIKFTHAIAWLLGMLRRADTLETTLIVRSLLKYLSKRGIFRNNMFCGTRVFREGKNVDDVKAVSIADLSKHKPLTLSLDQILAEAKAHKPHIVLKSH